MRRLSIIDLAGGHQPISNEDGSLWLVCNGEIYNFRQLTQELSRRGHSFKTRSDSEVILHLYEEHGDECIRYLDGMFGFALWDDVRKRLLLGRDRLGIKPLYVYRDAARLAFSSELKPLLQVPGIEAELDVAALPEFLALGYTPGPFTLLKGIRKLPPASLVVVENDHVTEERYWELPEVDNSLTEADCVALTHAALRDTVRSQMVSDVPIGAFLSGGVDSSAVVAFMAKASDKPIRTYSIGFEGSSGSAYYNELPHARKVAAAFGTQHREIIVRPDVAGLLPRLLWHMEEPIADAAFVTTYLVAEFARQDVTVILSGVGGDELFAGYRRYLGDHYGARYRRLPRWLRERVIAPLAARLPADRHSSVLDVFRLTKAFVAANELGWEDRYRTYVEIFRDSEIEALLGSSGSHAATRLRAILAEPGPTDPLNRLLSVDMATQLPDDLLMLTDKMTMASSLECRVPLLGNELIDLSARIPSEIKIRRGRLKHVLKCALASELPAEILERKKRGFGAPMGAWLKAELAPLMHHVISPEAIERRGLFDPNLIGELIDEHRHARQDRTEHLLGLMNFEIWARLFLDQEQPEDIAGEMIDRAAA
jgi:asparagine synthase (glutamine-hydrolysing)